ncbi:MAG: FecR domain-containing protein [Deltaproteobacteria bacterium]|nr:FecR domain-containing protein [Deltaproteobacteria bacterium]
MKQRQVLMSAWVALALMLICSSLAGAEVVGRLTQVEGRVDLLKGGQLPATPVKVADGVQTGDVLRTKSLSKAQITFIDNSTLTISPESRVAIEAYMFDSAQNKRNAVIQLFSGLAHVLVNKVLKAEEPDFVVKTQTAIMGVRGTDFGVRLQPNGSEILNFEGRLQVGNIFPEVSQLFRRAAKIAFAWGGGGGQWVILNNMQGTTVTRGLPPTLPFTITSEDRRMFMNQMATGLLGRKQGQGAGLVASSASSPSGASSIPAIAPAGLTTGAGDPSVTLLNIVTVPPTVLQIATGGGVTPTPTPTPSTFSFTQQYSGAWMTLAAAPYSQSTLLGYSWGQRTGVYDGYFYATTDATRTSPSGVAGFFPSLATGTSTGTATGTVTGFLGQTLTGTMNYTGTSSSNSTINRTGTVTILPSGALTYVWTDTATGAGGTATGSGTSTQTPGTYFSQTATGTSTGTANLAGNQFTVTNSVASTGARVEAGITTSFKAGFSNTYTAPNAGTFPSSGSGSFTLFSEGVLGAPDTAGGRTGVMTLTSPNSTEKIGGPVRDVPATSLTPAATFTTMIGSVPSIPAATSVGVWAQTPDPAAHIITQTHEGGFTVTSSPPNTTGTLDGTGWGYRKEHIGSGSGASSVLSPTVNSLAAALNVTSGDTLGSNPELLNQTVAAVVLPSGGIHSGPAQGVGIVSGDSVVSTTGTVNIDVNNNLTHNFNGAWVSPDNRGTLTSGVQTTAPGAQFTQTTNPTPPGSVILSAPSTTAPFTQTSTFSAEMTLTGVTGPLTLSGTVITSFTSVSGALPPAGTVPAFINMEGVVTPGQTIQSGNMTMTTHQALGSPVSTYMGPVSINTLNNTLNANVVGRNRANPGVNRVPARQTGTVVATPLAP